MADNELPHENSDNGQPPSNGNANGNHIAPSNGSANGNTHGLTEGQRRYMGIGGIEQLEAIWEAEKNIEEIKNLDTQLDKLNTCLDKIDHASDELNVKLKAMLEKQQKVRTERRASLTQREKELHEEQAGLHSQVHDLLNNARMARKSVTDFNPEVDELLEKSRALRMGDPAPSDPKP